MPLAGKPISAYRRTPPPLPPRWQTQAIERPPLYHFVLLSMLLHALFILLFGAPSGGSREGRALWGSLQVVLQASPPAAAPALKLDSSLMLERPRPEPTPRSRPKAAADKRVAPAAPSPEFPRYEAPPTETPFSMPPVLDRILRPDRKLDLPPPLQLPPPTDVQTVRPLAPATPAPRPQPAPAPVVAEPPPAPPVERVLAEPIPLAAPLAQPPPLPVPLPFPERLATPPVERAPVEAPAVPAIPATPRVERPPVEAPAIPVPSLESVTPAPSDAAPKPVERAPVQEIPAPPPLPPAIQRAQPPVQERETPARVERELPAIAEPAVRTTPFSATLPSDAAPKAREEAPKSTYDPTTPSLDMDAIRQRAASMAREGTGRRAVLPFPMPPVPERKTKEQIAIENARKPDCKTAYQSLGLLAIAPLIANEFGEGNCRW